LTLGADLEQFLKMAYSKCSRKMRNKIACSQFAAALSEEFIKRTIQFEGISSLKSAIKRANIKAIKIIDENSFPKKKKRNKNFKNISFKEIESNKSKNYE